MLPAQLLTRLRASALYLLVTVVLLGGSARALVVAIPQVLAADRAEHLLEPFDRTAYENDTFQTNGQEHFYEAVYQTHRQYDAQRRQANEAMVPVFAYAAALMLALMVYVRTSGQRMAVEVGMAVATLMCLGLVVAVHWLAISRVARQAWAMLTATVAPEHAGSQLLLLALLAGAALCYDLLRSRKTDLIK